MEISGLDMLCFYIVIVVKVIVIYTLKLDKCLSGPDRELTRVASGKAEVMGSKAGNRKWWLGV